MAKFERLGLPGCITLFDAVHVGWDMCPTALAPLHKGKEGTPTRVWNVAADVNRRIHHVHGSDMGARNDKTLARFDAFMQDVKLNRRYGDATFTLYTSEGEPRLYKGAWGLTDGGYHRWVRTQCPLKTDVGPAALFSKRAESIRKPQECVFGVMKRRWRIIKGPMRLKAYKNGDGIAKVVGKMDNIFKMCAMMHNMILEHNDQHTIGEREGDWTVADLEMDEQRVAEQQKAAQGQHVPHHVNDGLVGNDVEPEVECGYWQFRAALVTHFNYKWEKAEVEWLKSAHACRNRGVDNRPMLPPGYWREREEGEMDEDEVFGEEEEDEEEEEEEEEGNGER